jgi:hypothetical protein
LVTAALQVVAMFTPELKSSIVSVAMFLVAGASLSFWTDYQRSTTLVLFLVGANALGACLYAVRGAWDPVIFASLSTPGYLLLLLGRPARGRIVVATVLLTIHTLLFALAEALLLTGEI